MNTQLKPRTTSRFVVRFSDSTERECNAACHMHAIMVTSCQQILASDNLLIESVDKIGVGRVLTGPLHLSIRKVPMSAYERRWTTLADVFCATVTALAMFLLLCLFAWLSH